MLMASLELVKRSWHRGTPRFLARNARWVAEARDTPSLWIACMMALPADRWPAHYRPVDEREEEWISRSSAT